MLSDEERRLCKLEAMIETLEERVWKLEDQLEIKEAVISHLLGFHHDPKKHNFMKLHPILKVAQGDFFYFSEDIALHRNTYICDIIPLDKFVDFFKNYMFLYEGTKELNVLIQAIFVNKYVVHQHSQKFYFRECEIEELKVILQGLPKPRPSLNKSIGD